jgi:uncharacterized protein (DUF433 family)
MAEQERENRQDHHQPGDGMVHDRRVIDPAMQHGTPVSRGTRVPVARLLGGLAGGLTPADVCQAYDSRDDDLRAVLAYAATLMEADQCHPLPRRPVSV